MSVQKTLLLHEHTGGVITRSMFVLKIIWVTLNSGSDVMLFMKQGYVDLERKACMGLQRSPTPTRH